MGRKKTLIFAEELLGIFYKADNHYDGRASHANEEHDLQDVHCEDSNLKHFSIVFRFGGRFHCPD